MHRIKHLCGSCLCHVTRTIRSMSHISETIILFTLCSKLFNTICPKSQQQINMKQQQQWKKLPFSIGLVDMRQGVNFHIVTSKENRFILCLKSINGTRLTHLLHLHQQPRQYPLIGNSWRFGRECALLWCGGCNRFEPRACHQGEWLHCTAQWPHQFSY